MRDRVNGKNNSLVKVYFYKKIYKDFSLVRVGCGSGKKWTCFNSLSYKLYTSTRGAQEGKYVYVLKRRYLTVDYLALVAAAATLPLEKRRAFDGY